MINTFNKQIEVVLYDKICVVWYNLCFVIPFALNDIIFVVWYNLCHIHLMLHMIQIVLLDTICVVWYNLCSLIKFLSYYTIWCCKWYNLCCLIQFVLFDTICVVWYNLCWTIQFVLYRFFLPYWCRLFATDNSLLTPSVFLFCYFNLFSHFISTSKETFLHFHLAFLTNLRFNV